MSYRKIGILHLNQIGDLAFALPLVANLRANCPEVEIHSIMKPYLSGLWQGQVERIIARTGEDRLDLIKLVRREHYDLLISLARSEECLIITALSGAGHTAGFHKPPLSWTLDTCLKIEGHNCWHNNRRLLEALGMTITKNDYVGLLKASGDIGQLDLPERFAVISPGASINRQAKTWDNAKFADLIIQLYSGHGLMPVLVGSSENAEPNRQIIAAAQAQLAELPALDLAGHLSLAPLCSLLRRASLFVGIDSGVMHLASSLDIPTVGIFGPTDDHYVGPQNAKSRVVKAGLGCQPCYLKPCEHLNCMRQLETNAVMQACRELLNGNNSHHS
ncbi:MAG: Lipopolysaccharide core heptosyltransferase RfaQ [Deltaproteobacteria bacterium ADurb.Bin510]|nr:MAG: Lipopolysaccharide core heptosyltransferase RfaQ [Deltaproteobacteria bacterium ADurb.Bin510]